MAEAGYTVTLQHELVDALNTRRMALGLQPVAFRQSDADKARSCALASAKAGKLRHCGHEVLWGGGRAPASAAGLIDAWFKSPAHRTALTYRSSTFAGGAVVRLDSGGLVVAALRINY